MSKNQTNDSAEFVIQHEFNAPKKLVFDAFKKPEALNEWWGPAESVTTVISLDFRPNGVFHYSMNYNGNLTYGRMVYHKIQPPDLLEITNSFADEHGNVIRAPFDIPHFPLEIHYVITFAESNGKTMLTLKGQAVNASAEEKEALRSIRDGMNQGFGGTFGKLATYLGK